MPTIANSLTNRNKVTLEERLSRPATQLMPKIDPCFRDMILSQTKTGAKLFENMGGRDWQMKKRYYGSVGGVLRQGNVSGYKFLVGDQTALMGSNLQRSTAASTLATGVDPLLGAKAKSFGMTMDMHVMEGDFYLHQNVMDMEAIEANIREFVNPEMVGVARNVAITFADMFHADPGGNLKICSLGASTGTSPYVIDAGNKKITFFPVEKTTARFAKGQMVDLYSGTTQKNVTAAPATLPLYVDSVNHWQNKVVLAAGSADDFTQITNGNLGSTTNVHLANQYDATYGFRALYAWKNWAVWENSATTAQNYVLRDQAVVGTEDEDYIDCRKHPEFQSGYFENFGTVTETKLTQVMETVWQTATAHGLDFDTLMFSRGILQNISEQYASVQSFDRGNPGGKPSMFTSLGRDDGFQIRLGDRTLEGYLSNYLESGTILGMLRKNNWALVTPPVPSGGRSKVAGMSDESLDAAIPFDFYMTRLGAGQPNIPYMVTDASGVVQPTQLTRFPFRIRAQFIPVRQIPMFVLTGCTESRLYSSIQTS